MMQPCIHTGTKSIAGAPVVTRESDMEITSDKKGDFPKDSGTLSTLPGETTGLTSVHTREVGQSNVTPRIQRNSEGCLKTGQYCPVWRRAIEVIQQNRVQITRVDINKRSIFQS
jgi:hypothetical protein